MQVAALDSIGIQNRAGAATWSAKQADLRGYGTGFSRVRAAGDTVRSKIPGQITYRQKSPLAMLHLRKSRSNNVVRVGIISND